MTSESLVNHLAALINPMVIQSMQIGSFRLDSAHERRFLAKFKHPSSRFREIKSLQDVASNLLYQYNKENLNDFLEHQEYTFILTYFLRRIVKAIEVGGPIDQYVSYHKANLNIEHQVAGSEPALANACPNSTGLLDNA